MTDPPSIDISVVITAHNEAAHIRSTLHDLAAQDVAQTIEVIVVDDRSIDATHTEVRAADLLNLRLLTSEPDPASPLTPRQQALDKGFRAARGTVIATLDADSRVGPDWLTTLCAPILKNRADAVAGPILFDGPVLIAAWQGCDAAHYLLFGRMMASLGLAGGAMFGNFAFRAALYPALGGFAALGATVTEDLAFARAVQKCGARLCYCHRHAAVTVRACASVTALVQRTLRITRAPLSPLGAVLTAWPFTLLALGLWTLFDPAFAGGALLLRYGLGVAVVTFAALRDGARHHVWLTPFYEPLVFALAAAAAIARLKGRRVEWGGRSYD